MITDIIVFCRFLTWAWYDTVKIYVQAFSLGYLVTTFPRSQTPSVSHLFNFHSSSFLFLTEGDWEGEKELPWWSSCKGYKFLWWSECFSNKIQTLRLTATSLNPHEDKWTCPVCCVNSYILQLYLAFLSINTHFPLLVWQSFFPFLVFPSLTFLCLALSSLAF